MPDARRSPILKSPASTGLCAFLAALALLHCGPGIKVAGGTSEVGNPANATLLDDSEDEDTASTAVGVRFDLIGSPISIIKEKKAEKHASAPDSVSASAVSGPIPAAASLIDTLTQTLTDTLTQNPAD